jgi:hypothetical protein
MPKPLTWDDAEDIGILLSETHPELSLKQGFKVSRLQGFKGFKVQYRQRKCSSKASRVIFETLKP